LVSRAAIDAAHADDGEDAGEPLMALAEFVGGTVAEVEVEGVGQIE
jgi:hypothetical protein